MSSILSTRKISIALLIALVLFTGITDWIIPRRLTFTLVTKASCPAPAARRIISRYDAWRNWWPDHSDKSLDSFAFGSYRFVFSAVLADMIHLDILQNGRLTGRTQLSAFDGAGDSCRLFWRYDDTSTLNPIDRIRDYRQAGQLARIMKPLLDTLAKFLSTAEGAYGLRIEHGSIDDSLLLFAEDTLRTSPDEAVIDEKIDKLIRYAVEHAALRPGEAKLNTYQLADGRTHLRVAIPVSKTLPATNDIRMRRMVRGDFLIGTVRGGPHAIAEGIAGLSNFIADHNVTVMAVPFQSMITDRRKYPDSATWITQIYFPVFR